MSAVIKLPEIPSADRVSWVGLLRKRGNRAIGDEAKIKAAIASGASVSDILKSFKAF